MFARTRARFLIVVIADRRGLDSTAFPGKAFATGSPEASPIRVTPKVGGA